MTLCSRKVLRPYTIIPPELYVERDADRQLARILNEMGRPGYVLVARQMGKTNLLLNAKRNMAGGPDAFVYVDVSNFVPDLRTFFRSIIDTCIDAYPEHFDEAALSIRASRASGDLSLEHKEHETELRGLLKAHRGRLVICLDEIDALTKSDYSDQAFSFIRSVYFSGRTNFPEFSRLTYVLSGVAEPTEIIKNRSISPFNIGEKIYLDDFSRIEFQHFLSKAQLNFEDDVVSSMYEWTGGNPRISWDLCAAAESHSGQVSPEVVSSLVQALYLRTFDLPPVDHIRTLVETDKEVRSAIMAIHYGKADSITDAVKSRLYLAGITSLPAGTTTLGIKNKIIEAALSEKWLAEVERKDQSTADYANSLFQERRYAEALVAYIQLEIEGAIDDLDVITYKKASCQYFMGDYAAALLTFTSHPLPKSRSVDLYVACQSRIGSCQQLLGCFADSKATFEKLIGEFGASDGDLPTYIYEAKLNLSAAYLRSEPPDFLRTIEICESVIANADKAKPSASLTSEALERYRSIAHYNRFFAAKLSGDKGQARVSLEQAIQSAGRSDRATLLLEKAREEAQPAARTQAAIACVEYCITNDVAVSDSATAERPLSFTRDHAVALLLELEGGGEDAWDAKNAFLGLCQDPRVGHEVSVYDLISIAANVAFSRGKEDAGINLYKTGAQLVDPSRSAAYLNVLSFYLAISDGEELIELSGPFVEYLRDVGSRPEGLAARAMHRIVREFVSIGAPDKADAILCSVGLTEFAPEMRAESVEQLVDLYVRLMTDIALSPDRRFGPYVRVLFEKLDRYTGPKSQVYHESYRKSLMSQLLSLAPGEFRPKQTFRITPKVGRNEVVRYRLADGSEHEAKYKKVELLLSEGKASLIDNGH